MRQDIQHHTEPVSLCFAVLSLVLNGMRDGVQSPSTGFQRGNPKGNVDTPEDASSLCYLHV